MITKAKKKSLFIFGLILTGVFSFFTDRFLFSGYSKETSLLCKAYADVPPACGSCGCPWTESQCVAYASGNGGGDGCCSDSSAGGGGASDGASDAGGE